MPGHQSYAVLSRVSEDTLEFVIEGRVQQAWKVAPPLESIADLMQRCLTNLGHEGWRPISHQPNAAEAVVLARVPYPAGTKLAVYGTLRFVGDESLVLCVSGAVMQHWKQAESAEATLADALSSLERQGWRVHRRYMTGATVVRG